MQDLNEVRQDLQKMQEEMNEFGFNSDSLRKAENMDFQTMHAMIVDTLKRI